MRLPEALYNQLQYWMKHHGDWHTARTVEYLISYEERGAWQQARATFPDLKFTTEAGSGEQFLKFHRDMLREFYWITDNTAGHDFTLTPWAALPAWLMLSADNPGGFTPDYIDAMKTTANALAQTGTIDELGNFLESTELDTRFGSGIHNHSHSRIAAYETRIGADFAGAEMESFGTSHYNEYFWLLHEWLDGFYRQWQKTRGIEPDLSPKMPGHHH